MVELGHRRKLHRTALALLCSVLVMSEGLGKAEEPAIGNQGGNQATAQSDAVKTRLDNLAKRLDAQEESLAGQKERLEEQASQLGTHKNLLASLEARLNAQGKQLTRQENQLQTQASQLEADKKRLDDLKTQLDAQGEQLEADKTRLGDLKEQLEAREARLDDLKKQLDEQKGQLSSQGKTLDEIADGEGVRTLIRRLATSLAGVSLLLAVIAFVLSLIALSRRGRTTRLTASPPGDSRSLSVFSEEQERHLESLVDRTVHDAVKKHDVSRVGAVITRPRVTQKPTGPEPAAKATRPESQPETVSGRASELIPLLCRVLRESGRDDQSGEYRLVEMARFKEAIGDIGDSEMQDALDCIRQGVRAGARSSLLRDREKVLFSVTHNRGGDLIRVKHDILKEMDSQDWGQT